MIKPLQKIETFRRISRHIGIASTVRFAINQCPTSDVKLRPKGMAKPLTIRGNTSDIEVFKQIFIQREYSPLLSLLNVGLVIDAGANVGFSSAFFLHAFPECEVVAIEPDSKNFAALLGNTAQFPQRITHIQGALWSHRTNLCINEKLFRSRREWSIQVRKPVENEPGNVQAYGIEDLLLRSYHERISILKVDIEGAEAIVFNETCKNWISKVDAIAIELHDDSMFGNASKIFDTAIKNHGFDTTTSGELAICIRRSHERKSRTNSG